MTISKEDMEELKRQTIEVLDIHPGTLLYGLDSPVQVMDALEQIAWVSYDPRAILEALVGTLAPANRDQLKDKAIKALKARELIPRWGALRAQTPEVARTGPTA